MNRKAHAEDITDQISFFLFYFKAIFCLMVSSERLFQYSMFRDWTHELIHLIFIGKKRKWREPMDREIDGIDSEMDIYFLCRCNYGNSEYSVFTTL